MSSFFGELGGLAGGTGANALALAAAIAAGRALEPAAVTISQDAWEASPVRRLGAGSAAEAAAQALADFDTMRDEASYSGYDATRFAYLYNIALTAPGLGELMRMARRSTITEKQFAHGLRKAQIEPQYDDALRDLLRTPLAPGEIGTAVHRGILNAPGLLITSPPTTPGRVPIIPPSSIDPVEQAAAWGMSHEQLRVLVGITGLPLSLGEMLQLLNRGKVTTDDVQRAIAESNIRNEYMDVALELSRRLLTPHEYAEAELRGYLSHEQAVAGAGLSGIEPADYATLFEIMGRPLVVRQITTGEARGGKYGGSYDDVPEGPYRDAIRRSAIRPEYAQLAYANRYSYPSLFQITRLVTANTIDAATGTEWAKKSGLAPEVVKALAESWAGSGTSADTHVAKAQTQLWTTLHRSYIAEETDDPTAQATLTTLTVPPAAQAQVLALWQAERSLIRKQLTPSQVKKAYTSAVVNPATGTAWTKDDAISALLDRGYSLNDATTFLNS